MLRVGSLLVRAGVALRGLCSSLSEELQGRTGLGRGGIHIRWSNLPFNLILVELTTNYSKNVITQGSGKGEWRGSNTPTQGAVTLSRGHTGTFQHADSVFGLSKSPLET